MDNREYLKVSKEIRNYKMARSTVLGFILFTVVNFVLLFANFYFLFSIYSSLSFFAAAFIEGVIPAVRMTSIIISLVILAAFVTMWALSKKYRWAMIVLFVLFALDLLFVLYGIITVQNYYAIVDLIVHAAMMYYLFLGVKSSGELQKHFPQGIRLTLQELNEAYRLENGVDPVTGTPVAGAAMSAGTVNAAGNFTPPAEPNPFADENAPEISAAAAPATDSTPVVPIAPSKPESPVLGEDTSGEGNTFLEATFNNSRIQVKSSLFVWGKARIIVDGKIYACEKVGGYKDKKISAVVNGVEYVYDYRANMWGRASHTLYANGLIIAAK